LFRVRCKGLDVSFFHVLGLLFSQVEIWRVIVDERDNGSGPGSMSLEELKSQREALAQKFEYAMYRLEDSEKWAQKSP
jgi:hypothetical protein